MIPPPHSGRRASLALAAVLWAAAAAAAAAPQGRDLLERYLAGTETLAADFRQTVTDEQGEVLDTAEGRVYVHRPGRFRWDYHRPYEQSIVADGETVWVYDKDLAQITRRPLEGALGETPAALLGQQLDLEVAFRVLDSGHEGERDWVVLEPRGPGEGQYERIRLAFEGGLLSAMELADSFGQRTLLEFSDQRRNLELDPGLFEFEPPEGVDVVTAGGVAP